MPIDGDEKAVEAADRQARAPAPRRRPSGQGIPAGITSAPTSAESAAVEPTERSSSPAEMTKVMATAMIVTIAVVRAMLNRFVTERKPLSPMVIAEEDQDQREEDVDDVVTELELRQAPRTGSWMSWPWMAWWSSSSVAISRRSMFWVIRPW